MRIKKCASPTQPIALPPLQDQPLCSIITPLYNCEDFIEEAVASVQAQSWFHWEMIICDDGSNDSSRRIVDRLARADGRIRLFAQSNQGVAAATQAAMARATGQIMVFLDSDDVMLPSRLEHVVLAFHDHPHAGVVVHRLAVIDYKGRSLGRSLPAANARLVNGWLGTGILDMSRQGSAPPSSGSSVRSEVARRFMPVPPYCQSQDAYITGMAMFFSDVVGIDEVLGQYRVRADSLSCSIGGWAGNADMQHRRLTELTSVLMAYADTFEREGYQSLAATTRSEQIEQYNEFWRILCMIWILERRMPPGFEHIKFARALREVRQRRLPMRLLAQLPPSIAGRLIRTWSRLKVLATNKR